MRESIRKWSEERDLQSIQKRMRKLYLFAFGGSALAGVVVLIVTNRWMYSLLEPELESILAFLGLVLFGGILGEFLVLPLLLVGVEALLFLQPSRLLERHKRFRLWDLGTLLLGAIYTPLYLSLDGVMFGSDWSDTLINAQVHTPIQREGSITILVIALVAFAGYLVINYIPLEKMPPLLLVLSLSAMYLGTLETLIWSVQVISPDSWYWQWSDLYLVLLPIACVLITARTVIAKMQEWKQVVRPGQKISQNPILRYCAALCEQARLWPLLALLLMWPLLGILIAILVLFGQEPDAVIKAWTETSDWNLSQRVAPQNVSHDEHYLCTVAAGGHKKVVKPLRLGVRHGHEVIVNRQLCVANAFEQVLEEKTPRFHRAVRHFYDTYGFPIARLIHSRYMADAIYLLMKPLEWIFLAVLYLTDPHPENRIAVQYMGRRTV